MQTFQCNFLPAPDYGALPNSLRRNLTRYTVVCEVMNGNWQVSCYFYFAVVTNTKSLFGGKCKKTALQWLGELLKSQCLIETRSIQCPLAILIHMHLFPFLSQKSHSLQMFQIHLGCESFLLLIILHRWVSELQTTDPKLIYLIGEEIFSVWNAMKLKKVTVSQGIKFWLLVVVKDGLSISKERRRIVGKYTSWRVNVGWQNLSRSRIVCGQYSAQWLLRSFCKQLLRWAIRRSYLHLQTQIHSS